LNHTCSVCWTIPVLSVEPYLFCLLNLPLQHMSWTVLTFLVLPVLLSYYFNAGLYLFFLLLYTTLFCLLSCIGPCSFCYCPVLPAELCLFCLLNPTSLMSVKLCSSCWVALFCMSVLLLVWFWWTVLFCYRGTPC
jgi:hypothetical protein